MLQLLDLARENAALRRELANILANLEEAQHCLAVFRNAWGDDRTCSSFESESAVWPALTEYVKHRHGNVYRELHVSTPEAQAWCDAVARLIEDVKRKHNVG
jgi:hypothetical protein